jgi:HK97 family phage major capsid protein
MSEFIAKQVDAKAKAWHEAKELIDSVEARGGVWSGEDEAKYASLTADINKRNELIELEQREAKVAEAMQSTTVDFAGANALNADAEILRKMVAGEIRGHEFRAITGSSTGAPVPTSFYNEIVKVARLVNPLLEYATVINTASGENLQIPSQATFSTATIVGQGVSIGTSEPTFNAFTTLGAYKFSALAQLSRELIADSGVDIIGFLAEQFGNALGFKIADEIVNGTGNSLEPVGFLPVAGTGVTGSASTTAVLGPNTVGGFTADNVIDLIYSLDGSLRQRPSFAMLANSTSIAALRKLKDGAGNYIFQVGDAKDRRDLVLGVPVIETPAMPSPGSAVNSLACGDLRSIYIRNAGGLEISRSDDFAFGNDLATWRATWRLDSALVQTANIKKFRGGTA